MAARKLDEGKRNEIAVAALDVLRRRGLANTSMSTIARELGMKRPTLYFYFPSLSDIFEHFLESVRNEEMVYVGTRLMTVTHPIDMVDTLIRAEHEFFAERGMTDFVVLVAQFAGAGDETERARFRQILVQQLGPVREGIVAALRQGIADGRVVPCDPEAVFDFIYVVVDGGMVHAALRDLDPVPMHDFIRTHLLEPLKRIPPEHS